MELKVGSIVRLKSGGYDMTVRTYPYKTIDGKEYYDRADCQWFNGEGLLKHEVFLLEELDYEI